MKALGPILLSARLTLNAGQRVMAQSIRLQNPFRMPMMLDEIRYRIVNVSPSGAAGSVLAHWAIRARHMLGRTPLTSDFVPIGGLTVPLGPDYIDSGINFAVAGTETRGWRTWKLPKPLYIPGTELLTTELYHAGTPQNASPVGSGSAISPFNVNQTYVVDVVYAGRTISDDFVPEKICVPFASAFVTPFVSTNILRVDQSSEADIRNPFNEELHVQRFIGRSVLQQSTTPAGEFDNLFAGGSMADITTLFTKVRAADSFGRILVRDPAPFTHLFYLPDRTWTVNTKLQPRGFYLFEVERDFTSYSGAVTANANIISMMGYREVYYQP